MKGRTEIAVCGVRRDAVAKAERGPLAALARYALVAVACLGLTCALALPIAAQDLSEDATLSALVVNDGSADLPLEPAFSPRFARFIDEYYVDVSHDVVTVTVTATPNHAGATVEYEPPNVLPLEVGYQTIRIDVTSEDEYEDETYKVGVFRAPPATPSCTLNPGDIWCSLLPVTLNDPGLLGASIGDLSDFDFTYKDKTYRFRLIRLDADGQLIVVFYPFNAFTSRAALAALNDLYLQVGSASFRFSEAVKFPNWFNRWYDSGLVWSEGSTVTVRLRENPLEVESVAVTSWPQSGGHVYRWGDTILFTLTFSGKVRVEGQPTLVFDLGGDEREARFWGLSDEDYERGQPSPRPRPEAAKVHFGYTVQPGDFDSDGVVVGELSSAIRLGGARILSAANGVAVELSHAALGQLMDHTVDGGSAQPPAGAGVTIVDTDGNPLEQVNGEYRLVIPENTSGRYGLKLNTRPTHTVDLSAIYGDGDEDLRVLPTYTPLPIAPDEWETTFWVDIRASRDDDKVDGERVFQNRVHSKDPAYNDLILPDVLVVEDDDATESATALEESSGEDDLETSAAHAGPQEEDEITALTASFEDVPSGHDGESAFTLRIAFSEAVAIDAPSVGVIDGSVTEVRRVDGRDDLWEITVVPASNGMVFVSLLQPLACGETGAICTADGRPLSVSISTVVPGPDEEEPEPLTASFESMPEAHNGERAFRFRVAFSEDIGISYQSLREDAFTVTGGRVTGGRRVDDRRDLFEMTVEPDGDGDVTITLEAGRECGVSGAICTKGENRRKLTNTPTATVAGPPASAPDKPTGLSATATHDSVTLTWDDPGDDSITGYVILRRVRVNNVGGEFDVLEANTGSAATTYTDNSVAASTTYTYRIKAINGAGTSERSRWFHIDTPAAPASKPAVADGPPGLAPNAPNPFNANTLIPYRLDADGPVRLEIYNLLGQPVRTLVNQYQDAGFYKVRWDARDRRGALVSAGMYLVRLHYPGGVQTQRLLYLK